MQGISLSEIPAWKLLLLIPFSSAVLLLVLWNPAEGLQTPSQCSSRVVWSAAKLHGAAEHLPCPLGCLCAGPCWAPGTGTARRMWHELPLLCLYLWPLPFKLSLSRPTSYLTFTFQFSAPSCQGRASECVGLICWLWLNHGSNSS